jgi:hypothetical protein
MDHTGENNLIVRANKFVHWKILFKIHTDKIVPKVYDYKLLQVMPARIGP